MREPILEKRKIQLENGVLGKKEFIITGTVGQGHSCIVYDAYYLDDMKLRHRVRLKELFPIMDVYEKRNEDSIIWKNESVKEQRFKEFVMVYKRHLLLQENYDFVNSTCKINDGILKGNNTLYISMEADHGKVFSLSDYESVFSLFKAMKGLCLTVKKYHDIGLLFLDIKPENIMVIPETDEMVKMFDFDSLISMEALDLKSVEKISYSNEWAAPEVKRGKLKSINESSDIYSIGLMLFKWIYGRTYSAEDRIDFGKYSFDGIRKFEGINPKVQREVSYFLRYSLNPISQKRFSDMKCVIDSVNKIIKLSNPESIFLCEGIPKQLNYFVGRNEELSILHNDILNHNMVIVTGIGGIGKTEIAIRYANLYKEEYTAVAWVKCETGMKEVLESDNGFVIAGIDEGLSADERLNSLKAIVDKDTLIIIDDIKDYRDDYLLKILELPCKFLITSRNLPDTILDSVYELHLECMSDEHLKKLFYHYCPLIEYKVEDGIVADIIHAVGNYTLLIPILARYIVLEVPDPHAMLQKIKDAGLHISDKKISHYKDGRIHDETMYEHARKVFNLVSLSEGEKNELLILSLLGGIKIKKKNLAYWCSYEINEQRSDCSSVFDENYGLSDVSDVNTLIEKGWLNYLPSMDIVSMHDIIRDVVKDELEKSISDCGFLDYISAVCDDIQVWYEEEEDQNHFFIIANEYTVWKYCRVVIEVLDNLLSYDVMREFVFKCIKKIYKFAKVYVEDLLDRIEPKMLNDVLMNEYYVMDCYLSFIRYIYTYSDSKKNEYRSQRLKNSLERAFNYAKENYFLMNQREAGCKFLIQICEGADILCRYYGYDLFSVKYYELGYNVLQKVLEYIEINTIDNIIFEQADRLFQKVRNTCYCYFDFSNKDREKKKNRIIDCLHDYYEYVLMDHENKKELWLENIDDMLSDDRLTFSEKNYLFSNLCYEKPEFDIQLLATNMYERGILDERICSYDQLVLNAIDSNRHRNAFIWFQRWYFDINNTVGIREVGADWILTREKLLVEELNNRGNDYLALMGAKALYDQAIRWYDQHGEDIIEDSSSSTIGIFLDYCIQLALTCNSNSLYLYFVEQKEKVFHVKFAYKDYLNIEKCVDEESLFNSLLDSFCGLSDKESKNEFLTRLENEKEIPIKMKQMFEVAASEAVSLHNLYLYGIEDISLFEGDADYLIECIDHYEKENTLFEKIENIAEICFQSIIIDDQKKIQKYLDRYIEVIGEIEDLDSHRSCIIQYFKLPLCLEKLGKMKLAVKILKVIDRKFSNDLLNSTSYSRLRILKSYFSDMYQILERSYSSPGYKKQFENKNKKLQNLWKEVEDNHDVDEDEDSLVPYVPQNSEEDNIYKMPNDYEEIRRKFEESNDIDILLPLLEQLLQNTNYSEDERQILFEIAVNKNQKLAEYIHTLSINHVFSLSEMDDIYLYFDKILQELDSENYSNMLAAYLYWISKARYRMESYLYSSKFIEKVLSTVQLLHNKGFHYMALFMTETTIEYAFETEDEVVGFNSSKFENIEMVIELVEYGKTLAVEAGAENTYRKLERARCNIDYISMPETNVIVRSDDYLIWKMCFTKMLLVSNGENMSSINALIERIDDYSEDKKLLCKVLNQSNTLYYFRICGYVLSGFNNSHIGSVNKSNSSDILEKIDNYADNCILDTNNEKKAVQKYCILLRETAFEEIPVLFINRYEILSFYYAKKGDNENAYLIYKELEKCLADKYTGFNFYVISATSSVMTRMYNFLAEKDEIVYKDRFEEYKQFCKTIKKNREEI